MIDNHNLSSILLTINVLGIVCPTYMASALTEGVLVVRMSANNLVPVIITARGGSKGIPGKNIAPCGGKPLIAWTVEAAKRAVNVARVIVSTDDQAIADAALSFGAEVPFQRPAELAGDFSSHVAVVQHAVKWLEANGEPAHEYYALIQPTCPLILPEDIDAVIDLAWRKNAESVITVTLAEHHPYYSRTLRRDESLDYFFNDGRRYTRRQDLPVAYDEAGAVYVFKRDLLLLGNSLESTYPLAYVLPRERAMDIDEPWDLHLADLILTARSRMAVK